jgi:hypothetical protein
MKFKINAERANNLIAARDKTEAEAAKSIAQKIENYDGLKKLAGEPTSDDKQMGLKVQSEAPNKSELPKTEEPVLECKKSGFTPEEGLLTEKITETRQQQYEIQKAIIKAKEPKDEETKLQRPNIQEG